MLKRAAERPIDPPRAQACLGFKIEEWFDRTTRDHHPARCGRIKKSVNPFFLEFSYHNSFDPAFIFNMDETWISPKGKKPLVLIPREWKTAPVIREADKLLHVTIIFCASADGLHIRPAAILPDIKNMPQDVQFAKNWFFFTSSSTGWINEAIYAEWVVKVFVPHIQCKRITLGRPEARVLLLLDGHSTRSSDVAKKALEDANVAVVVIPSHTSHVLQPLDRGVNRSFKQHLMNHITYKRAAGVAGQRQMMVRAAVKAAAAALNEVTITDCFERAGIVPWSKETITRDPTLVRDIPQTELATPIHRERGHPLNGSISSTSTLLFHAVSNAMPAAFNASHNPAALASSPA